MGGTLFFSFLLLRKKRVWGTLFFSIIMKEEKSVGHTVFLHLNEGRKECGVHCSFVPDEEMLACGVHCSLLLY